MRSIESLTTRRVHGCYITMVRTIFKYIQLMMNQPKRLSSSRLSSCALHNCEFFNKMDIAYCTVKIHLHASNDRIKYSQSKNELIIKHFCLISHSHANDVIISWTKNVFRFCVWIVSTNCISFPLLGRPPKSTN